jgi:hypothetical protein
VEVTGLVDLPYTGVDISGEGGDRCGVKFFKYPVADADNGDDCIVSGGFPIAKGSQRNGCRICGGPVDVEVADIQGMDIVVLKDIPFYAVEGKSGIPVIEAHGLGSLLAGK